MVHKFKKYSKKIMCMLSAGMFFVMAVFYPLESFRADSHSVGGTLTSVPLHISIHESELSYDMSNVSVLPSYGTDGSHNEIYFKWYGNQVEVFKTSSYVYAYRVSFITNSVSVNNVVNGINSSFIFGTHEDFVNDSAIYLRDGTNGSSFWFVSEYSANIPLYLGVMYDLVHSYSSSNVSFPSVDLECDITFYYQPFTIEDLMNDIYNTLLQSNQLSQQQINYLNTILGENVNINVRLQNMINYLHTINGVIAGIDSQVKIANQYLQNIQTELEDQTSWLQKIYNAIIEYFGLQGDDSVEDMPDQEMDNMLNIESELLGDASASDLQNDLNVSIDADSGSFVWNLIDRLITANSVVFGGFISVLSLGIVALILGR